MFRWTQDTIRFRADAAEYGGFDAQIAAHILPYIEEGTSVCDAGCGLGYLSLALAPHCRRVTAVDASGPALEVLRTNAQRAGVSNVDIVEGDLFGLHPGERFDDMAFCFFGSVCDALRAAKAHCDKKAFLIKKNWATHRFTLEEKPLGGRTFLRTCAALDTLSIPYQAETFPLEMGQPFRSLGDAELFFHAYAGEEIPTEEAEARIAERLTETGRADFPYYLPACRKLGLIVLNASDIPDSIETATMEEQP
jgi:SAM-dependent methyltransferase